MEVKETQKPLCKVSMNKNSVKIILISIRNRKYCKEMPVADSVIQYVPLGEGINQCDKSSSGDISQTENKEQRINTLSENV